MEASSPPRRRPRPSPFVLRLPLAALLLALLGAQPAAAQQICEARYRIGSSNTWNFVSLSPGQNWTGTVNNLRDIENVGRNDLVVRTSGIGGIIADNRLVANVGGGTLVLPPAVFNGLQLQRITCLQYATVYDAGDYLQEFGTSAGELAQRMADTASARAAQAQVVAGTIFSAMMEQLEQQAQATYQATLTAWQDFQAGVQTMVTLPPAIVEQHFPELHAALVATQDYTYGLPATTTALWTSHAQGARNALLALDASLGVSSTVGQVAAIDLATAFPELHALMNTACTLDPAPWNRLGDRYAQVEGALQTLGATVAGLWPSEIADPLLRDLQAVARRMAQGPCDADLAALARSMAADRQALTTYLQNAQQAIRGVDVRSLARGQEEFGRGLEALGTSTGSLLQLLLEQERLEQAVEFRAVEVRQAQEQLVGSDPGDRTGPAWLYRDYWERRARQGDPDQLEADAQALVTATGRYEEAVRAREAGWMQVGAAWERWQQDAAAVAGLVPRLEVQVRGVDELVRALSGPPALRTPARAVSEATACLSEAVRRLSAEFRELQGISGRLLQAVIAAFEMPSLPPEVAEQLQRTLAAHAVAASRAAAVAGAFQTLAVRTGAVQASVVRLAGVLSTDPGDRDYMNRVDTELLGVRTAAEALVEARAGLQTAWNDFQQADGTFRGEAATLAGMILPSSPLGRAVATLQGAMDDLTRDLNAVGAGFQSAAECTGLLASRVDAARQAAPARLRTYLESVAVILGEAASALVPPAVRSALDDAIAASGALVAAWGGVAQRAGVVGQRAEALAAAYVTLNSGLLTSTGVDQTAARVQAVRDAANAFWEEAYLLLQARGEVAGPQAQFVSSLQALGSAMGSAGMNAAWQGAGITYSAVDLNLISGEYDKAQLLAERWGSAATTFPQRLAAFVGMGSTVSAIQPQMTSILNTMQGHSQQLTSCVSQGISARTAILSPTLVNQAMSQATSGFQAQAQGVIQDLQGLVPPSANILDQVASVFQAAASLRTRIQGMGSTAASAFQTLAAPAITQAQAAAGCVQQRSGQMTVLANQAQALMYPGE